MAKMQGKSQLPYMSQKEKQIMISDLFGILTEITPILTGVVDIELYAAQKEMLQLSSINSEANDLFGLYITNAVENIDTGNTYLINACIKMNTIISMLHKCVDWDTQKAQDRINQLLHLGKNRTKICKKLIDSDAAEVQHKLNLVADTALKFCQ